MKKRLLAMVLAMLMLCTLLSFSILAAYDPDHSETEDIPWDNAEPEVVTYTVTLPEGPGYTVVTEDNTTVVKDGSFSFTVTIADGYAKDTNFAVKANGTVLNAVDGVYTIANITENQRITVEGVVEEATHTPGDIDGNGRVNALDVRKLKQYLADKSTVCVADALDVDGNGRVNALDVRKLKQYLADKTVVIH